MFSRLLILLCCMLGLASISYAANKDRVLEGYNWYSEKQDISDDIDHDKNDSSTIAEGALKSKEEQNVELLKENYRKAHLRALDNPTFENVLEEMILEQKMMDKSKQYSYQRLAVSMLDNRFISGENSSNVLHRRLQEKKEQEANREKLSMLAKDWGLVLQVSQDCSYCHTFAPIVGRMAEKYGFELLAASRSGEYFAGIKGVRDEDELIELNPRRETPMLYLIKSDGKEVYPIARGVTTEAQVIKNIKLIDRQVQRLF